MLLAHSRRKASLCYSLYQLPPEDSAKRRKQQEHKKANQPYNGSTTSPVDLDPPSASMIASPFGPGLSRRDTKSSGTGHSNQETLHGSGSVPPLPPPPASGGGTLGPQSASAIYQHIHDMASKRISTLDYLRKALVDSQHFQQMCIKMTILIRLQSRRPRVLV